MQAIEVLIQESYERARWQIENSGNPRDMSLLIDLDFFKSILLKEIPVPENIQMTLNKYQSHGNIFYPYTPIFEFVREVMGSKNAQYWECEAKIIEFFIRPLSNEKSPAHYLNAAFINGKIVYEEANFHTLLRFLHKKGFSDINIVEFIFIQPASFIYFKDSNKSQLSLRGEYLLYLLKNNNNLLVNSIYKNYLDFIEKATFSRHKDVASIEATLKFLYEYYPEGLEDKHDKYLFWVETLNNQHHKHFLLKNCLYLLEKNSSRFEKKVLEVMLETNAGIKDQFIIYQSLNKNNSNKYDLELQRIAEEYFKRCKVENEELYISFGDKITEPMSVAIARFYLQTDEVLGKHKIKKFINSARSFSPKLLKFLSNSLGDNSLEYLADALFKDTRDITKIYYLFYSELFDIISHHNFRPIGNQIWDFAENHANKANRELAAKTLSTLGDEVFERAKNLLSAKTADSRITGVLVLSKLDTELARKTLETVVGTEKNDDTRDVILETLADQLYNQPLSLSAIKDLISKAEKRGKLNKFSEKWIDETQLPALFWQEDGSKLSQDEVRFLFYRMARSKGLNSDIEARQVINALDKNKSGGFAKKLVQAFSDSGSNTKFKHYLTTAGQIGGNEILPTLNSIFKQNMDEKRYKMAEYAVEALAMVGTNKALRMVEVISRKFVSKRPSVSERATQALEATAQELNITADELADRIIPDFDFDGLFKNFEAGNEEYRAFVNSDFTLCFFDEDNKMRKSAPKDTPSNLKKEFKEIEKEIREVVKSQSGRLEKYLVEERRWAIDQWQDFFLQNPIMFVYAMKLLWGIFDKNGALKNVFYCSNDTGLYNHEDEEIEFSETDFIGILHPIHLNNELLTIWKDKSYELSFQSIFPQLERRCFYVKEEEKAQNYTRIFDGKDIPKGADYAASTIEKYGWIKSTGDGGHLDIIKKYRKLGIQAFVHIEGVYAWYQGGNAKATVHDVSFSGKNWQDKIKLEDIPPVFFSEVLADIDKLIQAI